LTGSIKSILYFNLALFAVLTDNLVLLHTSFFLKCSVCLMMFFTVTKAAAVFPDLFFEHSSG